MHPVVMLQKELWKDLVEQESGNEAKHRADRERPEKNIHRGEAMADRAAGQDGTQLSGYRARALLRSPVIRFSDHLVINFGLDAA
jgi:hypothetical protein